MSLPQPKLSWTRRLTISSHSRTDSLTLLKLNKAIEFCKFSLKVNRELLKVNDPFKLLRTNRLVLRSLTFTFSPETLLLTWSLTPKPFEVFDIHIIKIKHFTFKR
ncbi:MAG: hypothetical protein ACKERF_01575 [Candidatus Hodgkinia cicadicola]